MYNNMHISNLCAHVNTIIDTSFFDIIFYYCFYTTIFVLLYNTNFLLTVYILNYLSIIYLFLFSL